MAADKHQKFQQFGDRGQATVVAATVQSPERLAAAVQAASATDQRHNHDKRYSSSTQVIVQLPTTSGSEQLLHHRDQNPNQVISQPATMSRSIDENNNPAQRRFRLPNQPAPTINHCHHEAATRTLLFHHSHHHHKSDHHHHHHHNRQQQRHHHHRHQKNSSPAAATITTDSSLRTDIGSGTSSGGSSSGSSDETSNQEIQSQTPPPNYHEIPGIVPAYQGRSSGPPPSYDDVVNPDALPPSYQSLFGQVREAQKTSNGLVDLLRQLFLILIGTLGCTMIIGFLLLIPITMILVGLVYVNDCKAENIPTFLVVGGIVWIIKNILNCYNQFKRDSSTSNRPPPRRNPISSRTSTSSSSSSTSTSSTSTQPGGGDSPASVLILGGHNHQPQSVVASNHNNNLISSTTSTTTSTTSTTSTISATTRTRRELEQSANRIRTPSLIGITSFKCESMLNYFLIVWFFAGCIVVYRIYEPDYDNPMSQSYCHRTVYMYAFWLITSAFITMAIVLSCLCCLMASSLMNCSQGR